MHRLATSLASSAYAKAHDTGGSIHPKGELAWLRKGEKEGEDCKDHLLVVVRVQGGHLQPLYLTALGGASARSALVFFSNCCTREPLTEPKTMELTKALQNNIIHSLSYAVHCPQEASCLHGGLLPSLTPSSPRSPLSSLRSPLPNVLLPLPDLSTRPAPRTYQAQAPPAALPPLQTTSACGTAMPAATAAAPHKTAACGGATAGSAAPML